MVNSFGIFGTLHTIITVFWVILCLAVAGAAFFRFRKTPSAFLAGGGFALLAIARILSSIARFALPRVMDDPMMGFLVAEILFTVLYAILTIVIAAGVALVPRSLKKLASG